MEYSLSTTGRSGNSEAEIPAISNFAAPLLISASCFSSVSILTRSAPSERRMFPNIFAFNTISPGSATSASITVSIPISKSLPVRYTFPSPCALIKMPSRTLRLLREETARDATVTAPINSSSPHTIFMGISPFFLCNFPVPHQREFSMF